MSDLAEEIRNFIPCLVAPAKTYPLSIFIPMNQAGPESVDIEPVAVARKVLNLLQSKEILTDIHIGIGRIYSASSELKRSYQESLLALSYCGQSPVYHYDDLQVQQERNWESELSQEVQEIIEAVRFGNVAKVEMYSAQLVLKYANFQAEQDRICFYLLELLLSTYKICKDSTTGQTGSPGFEQIMAIFNNKTDLMEIFKEITQRIKALTGIVKEGRQNQVKSIIRQAKDFIDSQYTEQLSLEDISHTVGISPFYFSRLFREELGINFSEYVTKLRLEKAVLLLAQGLSVKECCFSVGYNDPNYFSRIFRKYYDITPSEYRDEQVQLKGRNST
jgi:two-component system, response regulator YesN